MSLGRRIPSAAAVMMLRRRDATAGANGRTWSASAA